MGERARQLASRIGYEFVEEELLARALSHRSAAGRSYERLEFLGDAILNFLIAERLFDHLPNAEEGDLTRLRARLVRRETLAAVAREIGLGPLLRLGGGELKSGGRDRDSILADALEALVAAIYHDGGMDACRQSVIRMFQGRIEAVSVDDVDKDPKTRLQEHLQAKRLPLPEYRTVQAEGADHERLFTVECRIEGLTEPVTGRGSSRRRAEQEAARKALARLREET